MSFNQTVIRMDYFIESPSNHNHSNYQEKQQIFSSIKKRNLIHQYPQTSENENTPN